jgi:hypothetical protein
MLIAIIAGFVGWMHGRSQHYDDQNGAFNGSKYVTPRPTISPSLPWSEIRLTRAVIPSQYNLKLKVDLTNFVFGGSVDIKVNCDEATKHVVVHVNDLNITKSLVSITEWETGRSIEIRKQIPAPINQFYVLELSSDLRPGTTYRIRFGNFSGTLQDNLRGLYRSHYETSEGETRSVFNYYNVCGHSE